MREDKRGNQIAELRGSTTSELSSWDITARTRVLGVIGYPIGHSLSPSMHNAALRYLGLDYRYFAFEVRPESLGQALAGMRAFEFAGLNVTIPHKTKVVEYLDELGWEARVLGAVNTICPQDGKLVGHNTDGKGFVRALREDAGVELRGKTILVLGTGGAARAVLLQLAREGASLVTVAGRVREKASNVIQLIQKACPTCTARAVELAPATLQKEIKKCDILVNATPIGMCPNEGSSLVPCEYFRQGLVACDLVYNPRRTLFLQHAGSRGAIVIDGTGMLIYQGAIAFELWTGKAPPIEIMREAVIQGLA